MIPFTTNPADKSGGAHHDNHHFQRMIAQKEHTAPQHTRFILPLFHPTKSSLRCMGGIFLQIEPFVVVQFSEICFQLLTVQPQSVILVLERSRT